MTEAVSQSIAQSVPSPAHETERLAALRRYNILDTPPEKAFDRITSLAARLFDVPTVLVSLVDESRAWFKSCYGFSQPEVAREATICSFALLSDDVLVVPDTRDDERFACNPFVQNEPGLRFYAGAPLITSDGFNLGTLCLLDTQPRDTFTLEQRANLQDLAAIVMDELELRLAARKIVQVDAALLEVTQGVTVVTGTAFFEALVQHLTKVLDVNYACISLLTHENSERVKTLAFCAQGEIVDNVEYELKGTPCLEVINQKKIVSYASGIQALFPDDHFLISLQIESYTSIPFFDSQGKFLGLLGVMDNKPINNVQLVESLLTLFATRIAAELERHQAEEMRQAAAQRLQLYADVVHNAQVGIVVWQLEDLDDPGSFRLLVANPAASEVTGFDFEPMLGKTMAESFPKLLQTPLVEKYLEVIRTGRSLDLGEVAYSGDGIDPGFYSVKAFPLPDHCLGLAFENITARKQIELQLQESQRYNQQIAEAVPGVLFVHDIIQQRNVYTNRQIADLLGYTSEQVQAMGENAVATLVHPDDLESIATYSEKLCSAPDGEVLGIEYRAHHANGGWRWMYTQSVVFKRTADGLTHQILGVSIDISDRKQSEETLQQREAELSLITNTVPALIAYVDAEQRYRFNNQRYENWFGLPIAEIYDRPLWELLGQSAYETIRPYVDQVLTGQPAKFETQVLHSNGEARDVSVIYMPQFNAQGSVEGFVALINDITDQKQIEKALRESEQWARLSVQVAQLGRWRLHLDTNLVEIDERMRQMWGEPDHALMPHLSIVIDRIHPGDRERVIHAVNVALDPQSSGNYEIEYRIVWDDGTEHWVLANGQALFEGEGASRRTIDFLGTAIDITDRKQAERALQEHNQRLNLLYETTRDLLSAQQPLDLMNQLFEQLSAQMELHYYYHFRMTKQEPQQLQLMNSRGLTKQQVQTFELIDVGQAMCGLVAQEQRQIVLNQAEISTHPHAKAICAMGVSAYAGQPLVVNGQLLGTLSFASLTRTEFTFAEIALLQAISEQVAIALERTELMASLQQQTEDLAQANRIKDEFLAVLSHELRSPLNPILGWTKLLQTGKFDAQKTKQALEIIERNAKQQVQLIDDLLDISKILRGKLALTEAPVDLNFTIEAALETMRLAAEAKNIEIKTDLDLSISPVLGDAGRLQQIALNLLSNAIKFTPMGGRVEICLEQVGAEAQIQVKDTGKGIAPEFLPYVFESFRQEDGQTTRKFGGLGLGLAIVRQLTELHGGTVRAESLGEGTGATFTIRLPLMQAQSVRVQSTNLVHVASPVTHPLHGVRVLVVDDEVDMRELVMTLLEQAGAIVEMAGSADEALAVFEQFQPMVLVSDIGMPETDGYELMRQVESRFFKLGRRIPAIALSAYAREQDQQQALNAGFQLHIAKPIEPEILVKEIAALVSRG